MERLLYGYNHLWALRVLRNIPCVLWFSLLCINSNVFSKNYKSFICLKSVGVVLLDLPAFGINETFTFFSNMSCIAWSGWFHPVLRICSDRTSSPPRSLYLWWSFLLLLLCLSVPRRISFLSHYSGLLDIQGSVSITRPKVSLLGSFLEPFGFFIIPVTTGLLESNFLNIDASIDFPHSFLYVVLDSLIIFIETGL